MTIHFVWSLVKSFKRRPIPAARIIVKLENIPEGIKGTIQTETAENEEGSIAIKVRGLPDKVNSTTVHDVTGIVDISELLERLGTARPAEGAYTVPVEFELPQGVTLSETVRVLIYIEEEE